MTTPTPEIIEWSGCYDDSWKGLIVEAAFAHPAKYARGLITRIFKHMLATGMIEKGGAVVDPFGGIGTGGIVAAGLGLRWYGCELEQKFYELGNANFKMHAAAWEACGDPMPVLVNGDSRKLRENLWKVGARIRAAQVAVQGVAQASPSIAAIVSSPPYNLPMSQDHNGTKGGSRGTNPSEHGAFVKYGNTPGQLEGLPMGDIDSIVSSPPYASGVIHGGSGIDQSKLSGNTTGKNSLARKIDSYGGTEGQLGEMPAGSVEAVVTSPGTANSQTYGSDPSNLGNLKPGQIDSVVTSPPYAGSVNDSRDKPASDTTRAKSLANGTASCGPNSVLNRAQSYGRSEGQLGMEEGETFWKAARDIVRECFAILKPGGYSAWVVKDFVRHKARVPFCDDWCRLLESQGFVVTTRVHAMLVKETRDADLFGGEDHVKTTERKSFFRRLAEAKGAPRIDWEEVVFARKPCES